MVEGASSCRLSSIPSIFPHALVGFGKSLLSSIRVKLDLLEVAPSIPLRSSRIVLSLSASAGILC